MESGRRGDITDFENHSRPVTTCTRRHRSTSGSRTARKDCDEPPSPAFVLKCAKEREKLRQQITKRLRQDLLALFQCETFSDLIVECDSTSKKCHSCIFAKRVPNLYKELLNNFKLCKPEICSNNVHNVYTRVKIPSVIEPSDFVLFLQKIYSEDDIRKEEVDLIRRLKNWTMEKSTNSVHSLHDGDINKSQHEKSASTGYEVSNVTEGEHELDARQVMTACKHKLSDSLEMVGPGNNLSNSAKSDSSTNISFMNDEKVNEEESSFVSGNSLESGEEDNGQEVCGSSSSSQMVRSGTFDLLCQMPLEEALDKNVFNDCEEHPQKPKSLNLQNDDNINSEWNCFKKINNENDTASDCANELDAETPIADPSQRSASLRSPGSMFQFFIDVDSLPESNVEQQKQTRSSTSSGFMFIDINSCDVQYSPTKIERHHRSISASVVNAKPKNIEPNQCQSKCTEMCNSSQNPSPKKSIKNQNVQEIQNDEVMLLPMSPIPRRKRINKETLSRKQEKKTTDSRQIDVRTFHKIDSNSVMSSSWKSDGAKSESSNNSQGQRLNGSRERHRSPSEHDDDSVYSEVSSIDSSLIKDRHAIIQESVDEQESLLKRTVESCSKLGEDLLRMFFDEINCDVIIQAEDREIKSHRCILVARSPYFSAMFTGEWIESQSNKINLKGFSYNSVHFALCHIYSGAVIIPKDNVNLAELALLSDLLSLDTLKEVVLFELKKNYCHFFHKPCRDCIVGVIDSLVLSSECGLHSLYQRCLSWIGKHFHTVWPTKHFASIHPPSLLNACYQSTVNQMTPDNVLETILNCDRLATSMPRVKWAEPVFALIAKLMEDSCNFVAENNDLIVSTKSFIALGKGRSWNISTVENTLLAAMNSLTPDVACKTLIQLSNILMISETESAFGYGPYVDTYVSLVKKMYRHCERFLIHNAGAVANCQSWSLLSPEVQKHIKDSAVIVFEFEKPVAPRPKLSSINRSVSKSKQQENSPICDKKDAKVERKVRRSPKPKSNSEDEGKSKVDYHIYDEVPVECGDQSGETFIEYASKVRRKTHSADPVKRSQVAKVTPFTVKSTDVIEKGTHVGNDTKSNAFDDLVAEIDAESNLVNSCLQEAEMLEQELTRKLAKQNIGHQSSRRTHLRRSSNELGSPRNQVHSKPRPTSGTCKPGSGRPPFK